MYRGFSGFAARSWGSAARFRGSAARFLWRLGTGADFSELFPKELRRLRWFQSPGMSVWAQRQIILELFPMGLRRLGTEAVFSELFPIDSDVYMRYWAQEGICHELFPMLSCEKGEQIRTNVFLCPMPDKPWGTIQTKSAAVPKISGIFKKQGEQICEMPLLCPNPGNALSATIKRAFKPGSQIARIEAARHGGLL